MTSEVSSVSSAEIWFTRPRVAGGAGLVVKTFGLACHDHCCYLRHGVEHSDSGAGSRDTRWSSDLPDHTCSRLQRQCGELGCSVELGGTKLVDEAPQRMASVGCSGGTCCWGSRSCASESLNWMNHRL